MQRVGGWNLEKGIERTRECFFSVVQFLLLALRQHHNSLFSEKKFLFKFLEDELLSTLHCDMDCEFYFSLLFSCYFDSKTM